MIGETIVDIVAVVLLCAGIIGVLLTATLIAPESEMRCLNPDQSDSVDEEEMNVTEQTPDGGTYMHRRRLTCRECGTPHTYWLFI